MAAEKKQDLIGFLAQVKYPASLYVHKKAQLYLWVTDPAQDLHAVADGKSVLSWLLHFDCIPLAKFVFAQASRDEVLAAARWCCDNRGDISTEARALIQSELKLQLGLLCTDRNNERFLAAVYEGAARFEWAPIHQLSEYSWQMLRFMEVVDAGVLDGYVSPVPPMKAQSAMPAWIEEAVMDTPVVDEAATPASLTDHASAAARR